MKGFTLLELIIYFSLLTLLMTWLLTSAWTVVELSSRNETYAALMDNSLLIQQGLRDDLEKATRVQVSPGRIIFQIDGENTTWEPENEFLIRSSGGENTTMLDGGVTLQSFETLDRKDYIEVKVVLSSRTAQGAIIKESYIWFI